MIVEHLKYPVLFYQHLYDLLYSTIVYIMKFGTKIFDDKIYS